MARTLILVAGYAASGKTRVGQDVARRLPACYLDKDTLTSPLVERLLRALNQSPGDRDSPLYRQEIRPLEYEVLTAAGLEAAALGADVALSAPFLAQLTDRAWTTWLTGQTGACDVQLRVVWVACNLATLRQRMSDRDSPRDRVKIAEWSAYSAAIDECLDRKFPIEAWRFDNSEGSNYEAEIGKLIGFLRGSRPKAPRLLESAPTPPTPGDS